jgi:uncharacterized protein YdbL (DUF1318 family)
MHPSLIPLLAPLALAGPLDDAAALLSRFPAGGVPQTDAVVEAIDTLGDAGGDAERPLLGQLAEEERGRVAAAASGALQALDDRAQAERRVAFAIAVQARDGSLPTVAALGALGPAEVEALAYAHAVLGAAEGEVVRTLEPVSPAKARALVADAERAERERGPAASVPLYMQAALSGEADGLLGLTALGVDAELLVLGMSTTGGPAPAVRVDPAQLDLVAVGASDRTVDVLVERAAADRPLVRMAALDGLATLARRAGVSPSRRAKARSTLAEARERPGRTADEAEPTRRATARR